MVAPPSSGSSPFSIGTGSQYCEIDAEGCLTDGDGDYGNYEECSVQVSRAVVLTARQYDVENDYDFLTIGFQTYTTSGNSQIVGVSAPAKSFITWKTDGSETAGGFVLCETSPASSASASDCTCQHGTPTLGSGSGATLCEASGSEDCSACDFGYHLSASAWLGPQKCVQNSSPYFSVISGGQYCRIDAQGCVTDGPGNYSIAGLCEIRMLDNAELNTTEYEIEDGSDYLTVTRPDSYSCVGTDYEFSAGGGPSGLFSKNTKIEWYSDKDTVAAGFVLCAGVPTSAACSKLGTECQKWPATPYCDIKPKPSANYTGSDGACKGKEDISSATTCTSLLATSTGNVNTFAPVQTTCEYGEKINGACKSEVWDPRNQTYQAVDNQVASLCAEFLPGSDVRIPQPLCCRPSDANLLRWLQRKFAEFDRQFGQCDNCLYSVKKLVCQLACDSENTRFHHADAMVKSYAGQAYSLEAAVCEDYCKGMYLACKHVKWNDTVAYIYKNDHIRFCKKVLQLTVTEEALLDVNEADPSYNAFRICTTETAEGDLHCLGEGVHSQLGLVSFLLCFFITMAAILSEQFEKLPTNTFIPDATVTLVVGVGFGALMMHAVVPLEDYYFGTHHAKDFSSFDVPIFSFLLLPIIIFSSAFNIEQYALSFFMMKFRKISMFAIFGTLSALLFTGSMTYYINGLFVDETNAPYGLLEHELQLWDAMMFGSLISAVDPVATLAAFATVGIDPRVYALIYGESILNDAVAIVAFSVFKSAKESEQTSKDSGEMALASFKTFVTMGIGSVAIGLVFGILVTFLSRFHGTKPDQEDDDDDGEDADDDATASAADAHMKDLLRADADGDGMITAEELTQPHLAQNINTVTQYDTNMDGKLDMDELRRWDEAKREGHKDEHEKEHKAVLESAVFFFASLSSYYLAECVHVSGIICALVCGLICNQFAVHWMSNHAKKSAKFFYITLSEISDHLILLWVGLLFYYALDTMKWRFSIVSLGLVVLSRALSVFLVGAIGNICSDDDHDVPRQHQFMMIAAGLRGAVALALVMQMPSIAAEEIASTTLFIIVVTNVVLGGLTAPMVSLLGIPNEKNGTLNLAAFTLTKREKEFAHSWHDKRDRLRKRIGLMDHHVANTDHQTTHQARREQLLMTAIHAPASSDLAGGADDDIPDDVPVEDADGSEEIIQNPLDTLDDVATTDGSEVAVQHPIGSPGDGRGED